jgi:hypothetical protein
MNFEQYARLLAAVGVIYDADELIEALGEDSQEVAFHD